MANPAGATHSLEPNRGSTRRELVAWVLHLGVYSILLLLYFLFVLRYLAGWFAHLFQQHRTEYAVYGIAVMIVQAVALESISRFILRCFNLGRK